MSAPYDLTFAGGWCEAWADRGQVSVGLGNGTQGERGQHVYLNLTPDEADAMAQMLTAAASAAREVIS